MAGDVQAHPPIGIRPSSASPKSPNNQGPVAVAGPDVTILQYTRLKLDGSASYDPDGSITKYRWDFNNRTEFLNAATIYWTYGDPGVYGEVLTVTDNNGAVDSDLKIVNVLPFIDLQAMGVQTDHWPVYGGEPTRVRFGWQTVESDLYSPFTAHFYIGGNLVLTQRFDGNYPKNQIHYSDWVNYTFASGNTVLREVLDVNNEMMEANEGNNDYSYTLTTEEANTPPVAVIVSDKSTAQVGELIHFDGLSSYDPDSGQNITRYEWGFDDSGDIGPVHDRFFTTEGVHNITLTVYSYGGKTNKTTKQVVVTSAPSGAKPDLVPVGVTYTPSNPSNGNRLVLTATVKNQGNTYASGTVSFTLFVDGKALHYCGTGGLGVGQEFSCSYDSIDTTFEGQALRVEFTVDENGWVNESDENNNYFMAFIPGGSPGSDLSIYNSYASNPHPTVGDHVQHIFTVKNRGYGDINTPFKIYHFLNGEFIKECSLSSLPSGYVYTCNSPLVEYDGKQLSFTTVVDPDNSISELDETNNVATTMIAGDAAQNNTPPIAEAGGPYTCTTGEACPISGLSSVDPDGDTLSYEWNINGHSYSLGAINYPFESPGNYTLSLTVSDGQYSSTDTATANVKLGEASIKCEALKQKYLPLTHKVGNIISIEFNVSDYEEANLYLKKCYGIYAKPESDPLSEIDEYTLAHAFSFLNKISGFNSFSIKSFTDIIDVGECVNHPSAEGCIHAAGMFVENAPHAKLIVTSMKVLFFLNNHFGAKELHTYTLYPSQDAFTNRSAPTTSYGSLPQLYVKTNSEASYLTFNLSGLPDSAINNSKLHIFAVPKSASCIRWTALPGESIDENTLNWLNSPFYTNLLSGSVSITSPGFESLDLTRDVNRAALRGQQNITVVLDGSCVYHDADLFFPSSESNAFAPTLSISYSEHEPIITRKSFLNSSFLYLGDPLRASMEISTSLDDAALVGATLSFVPSTHSYYCDPTKYLEPTLSWPSECYTGGYLAKHGERLLLLVPGLNSINLDVLAQGEELSLPSDTYHVVVKLWELDKNLNKVDELTEVEFPHLLTIRDDPSQSISYSSGINTIHTGYVPGSMGGQIYKKVQPMPIYRFI